MFERVWIYNTWYTHEALMADDAAWSAAKLAHGVCDKRRQRTLAPAREEEEERRRKRARSPTPHWDAETDTFSWPAETEQMKRDDYNRQSLTGW